MMQGEHLAQPLIQNSHSVQRQLLVLAASSQAQPSFLWLLNPLHVPSAHRHAQIRGFFYIGNDHEGWI